MGTSRHSQRKIPRFAFSMSSSAGKVSEIERDTAWRRRLNGLGLGSVRRDGNLPGFHFERVDDSPVREGTKLHAIWAS